LYHAGSHLAPATVRARRRWGTATCAFARSRSTKKGSACRTQFRMYVYSSSRYKEGAAALAHGNPGRRPVHATLPEVAERVIALAQSTYAGCNQQHLWDLLEERDGILLSRATVHRLLEHAGLLTPPSRCPGDGAARPARVGVQAAFIGQAGQIPGSARYSIIGGGSSK
jgi:hypothetical protein